MLAKIKIKKLKKILFTIITLSVSTLVTLGLCELILRFLNKPKPIVSGWFSNYPDAENNELKYRGQKINYNDSTYIFLLIGDSQVQARALSFDSMPEKLLEKQLQQITGNNNIKVFTLGFEGYGQDQQLFAVQQYFKQYRANQLIVWQTPDNDPWNNLFPTHWPKDGTRKPTYRFENGKLTGPFNPIGTTFTSKIKLRALYQRATLKSMDEEWEKFYPQSYQALTEDDIKSKKITIAADWQKRWDNNVEMMTSENLINEKSNLTIDLIPRSTRTTLALNLTNALLKEIEKEAIAHKASLTLIHTLAPEDTVDMNKEIAHQLNGKYYITSLKQRNDNIAYMNNGLTSVELPIKYVDYKVNPNDSHLNLKANIQVMQDLANTLAPTIKK